MVEIFVKKGARCRYTTIQNWSNNVYNLVTKRAFVEEDGTMEWVDGNLGCLTENARLYTNPRGSVSIKDLKAGDFIYTADLNLLKAIKSKVNAVVDQGIKPVFKVVTTNYREIEATANHPFLILRKVSNIGLQNLRWEKLENLRAGDWIGMVNELPDDGKSHPINFDFNTKLLKYKPNVPVETTDNLMWILGLYLGDGCMDRSKSGVARRIYFVVPPSDRARKKLEKLLIKVFRIHGRPKGISLTVNSTLLANLFLNLGFSGLAKTKRIPNWIFGLPRSQKLAFIEGYFDADGYLRKAMKKDGNQYGQIVFASANKQLLEDLKLLMITVGIDPLKISTYVKERKLYKDRLIEYTSHYLSMNIRGNLERIRDKKEFDPTLRFTRIRSIEPIGKQRVYDIEVDKTANFIANGIVVHNSKITMKYPSCYLVGRGARGEILSLALANLGQHQDAGGKLVFMAPDTSGEIISKSVSLGGGRTSYRGLVRVSHNAERVKCNVRCDALLLDEVSRSDTYPTMQVDEDNVRISHEASVSKIDADQLFYLMSRGLSENVATSLIVNGFIEPIVKELPLEYAVELNRLIQLNMEGSVG
ncbi:MAG TPA: SufD family Fe-S cluster assembly protein [Patescibacteria group bacterium]